MDHANFPNNQLWVCALSTCQHVADWEFHMWGNFSIHKTSHSLLAPSYAKAWQKQKQELASLSKSLLKHHLLGRELLQTLVRKTLAQNCDLSIITDCPVNSHLFLSAYLFLTWWDSGMRCHLLLTMKLWILTLTFTVRNLSKFVCSHQIPVSDVSALNEYCRVRAKHFSIWHIFLLVGWGWGGEIVFSP